ncbi:MAG: mechanosensitive ion channel family protein [Thermoplasmatota archaeon]
MASPISDALYDAGIKLGGFGEPFAEMESQFWEFLPGLIFLLVFILVGYVVGKLIANIFRKFLERIGFEKAMNKMKLGRHFRKMGFKSASHFISIFIFWFVFLIFLQLGVGAADIGIISDILSPIILFIPRALIAALLIVIGLYVGTLVSDMVVKALNKTGLKKSVKSVDQQLKGTGYSLFSILGIIIKVWVVLFFVQAALDILAIRALTDFVRPILDYFPRVVIAFFVVLAGLVIADYIVKWIRNWLEEADIGRTLTRADDKTMVKGLSILGIALTLVKVWVLVIFIQIALDILAIETLQTVINPILLYFPRILVAMAIIIIGLIVTDFVLNIVHKLLEEMESGKFIKPAEDIIKKPGIIMRFVDILVKITVMLIFINIAVAVLGIGILADLVATVILWIPNLFAAAIIVLLGLWVAGWLYDKTMESSKKHELPFPALVANAVKFLVIYIVITMALAQLGIEVPVLYLAFGITLGAVMIGLGAGFAYGLKGVMSNMGGYLQVKEIVKPGEKIEVGEYSGEVKEITRYNTIIIDERGNKQSIPNTYLVDNTVTTMSE